MQKLDKNYENLEIFVFLCTSDLANTVIDGIVLPLFINFKEELWYFNC